ncbi:DUF1016 N-terminal domain-containing protein [Chitinophaga agrisoli]|uniref:DUF1016 N-terminal domain-containing protein n=1 Tax=Chitinophaga agrisoli TaxID=2607653 RepID=UPI001661EF4F|nr:DUF1016 N-terminal domain-containing protein [Chitinophaga agrisoli]
MIQTFSCKSFASKKKSPLFANKISNRFVDKTLLTEIKSIITQARENAIRAVDHERVLMYWHIGKRIFEEEQQGQDRAGYGGVLN